MSIKQYKKVLTIAGSDSGGGAGIQADIKSISANGCYALSVITALTAQNTKGVLGIHPAPVEFVRQQLDVVLGDIGADAVKIGMLFSPELIATVAEGLLAHGVTTIVVDPVMVATSGDPLLERDAIATLKEKLIPIATLITPNIPEAEILLGRKFDEPEDLTPAAMELCGLGCSSALIKGGHFDTTESDDLLWLDREKKALLFPAKRIATKNTHGTGCTLSSAIAAGLAKGLTVVEAVAAGKDYITEAIASGAGYELGGGAGPVNHFFMLGE